MSGKGNIMIRIALDGPSGAGKSTLAKEIAKRLGIVYLDAGALYRTVGLFAKKSGLRSRRLTGSFRRATRNGSRGYWAARTSRLST